MRAEDVGTVFCMHSDTHLSPVPHQEGGAFSFLRSGCQRQYLLTGKRVHSGSLRERARTTVKREWGGLYASHSLAKRIIELAKDGERNPDVLCEQALSYFFARE